MAISQPKKPAGKAPAKAKTIGGQVGKAVISKEEKTAQGNTLVSQPEQINVTEPMELPLPHATVAVNAGQTINLGDFNSVKLGVLLTIPCDIAEIDAVFDFCSTWVGEKLAEMAAGVTGDD